MKALLYTIIGICLIFSLSSCEEEAEIKITNSLGSVRLDNLSFGDKGVIYSLLPGESKSFTISTRMDNINFPISEQLKFYMVKGDSKVFLYTKESFKVDKDQTLHIEVTEDTEVINPLKETKSVMTLEDWKSFDNFE